MLVLQEVSAVGEYSERIFAVLYDQSHKNQPRQVGIMNRESLSLLFTSADTIVDRCGSNW